MPKIYVIDFENANSDLNVQNNETFVWLADICDIESLKHYTYYDFDSFIDKIIKLSPAIFYSHNLKYDGIFLLDYLLSLSYITHILLQYLFDIGYLCFVYFPKCQRTMPSKDD